MTIKEQIDQLEEDIRFNRGILPNPKEDECHQMARLLVQDGYRRAKDVIEEVFEEIFSRVYCMGFVLGIDISTLQAIKEKYTEVEENDGI